LFKKQSKIDLYDELGVLLAQKEFIEEYRDVVREKERLRENIDKYTVPIVIVEGKTDKWILEKAWNALFPNRAMTFEIYPSGAYLNVDDSEGSAFQVCRSIELISPMTDVGKTIIGLFDNDREGNDRYKQLSNKIFESYSIGTFERKHKTKNIYGMLLPMPDNREYFVGSKLIQRFLEIEHYFDDEILTKYNLRGDKVAPDSRVFNINSNHKTSFSRDKIDNLAEDDFENFRLVFDKIAALIGNA